VKPISVKPIGMLGRRATAWTRASVRWLDRWRDHADVRLGAVTRASLGKWLASVAIAALCGGVLAVALHLLLQASLNSGPELGWVAVAVIAAVALFLLVVVARNTIVSFVVAQRRRTHMYGLLLSAAALLASVQACAGATVAIGDRSVSLWQAEQLYAWRAADGVPLLAIPRRLEWSQPVVAASDGGRAILVAFIAALAVPFAGLLVAIFHLTGGANVPYSVRVASRDRRWRPSISILRRVRLPRTGIVVPLVATGGFLWGGLGRGTPIGDQIAASTGFALAGAVAAVTLGAVVTAVLLWFVTSGLKVLWAPVADGPWMQLLLAAVLVWADNPVRQALLPNNGDIAWPWKFLVTLGLWAVITVLLLPIWVDPYLPESLLALGLLLVFAGPGAPGSERITAAIGWAPGGFAVGPAIATALIGLTGAYLAVLVSRAFIRAANAGGLHVAGWIDLRRELGGYAYIGLQVITAAAGVLMLVSAQPIGTPDALAAIAYHVVESLPGDLPRVAGWQLDTDVTGPLAGAVVVGTMATLIVVVAFPMVRATARWARLRPRPATVDRPLAEIPMALLANLATAREFLESPGESSDEPEQALAAAERDREKLRDLLGDESPVYWAADHAVSTAVDAYRTLMRSQMSRQALQWSLWSVRTTRAADAIAAIDVYAATAERWQMGADVVDEIESRVQDLEARERDVDRRESDAWTREHGVEMRERGVDAREQLLSQREGAVQAREEVIGAREQAAEAREQYAEERVRAADEQLRVADEREQSFVAREADVEARVATLEARAVALESREGVLQTRETAVDSREADVEARAVALESRETALEAREREAAQHEDGISAREQGVDARERNVAARETAVEAREHAVEAREQAVEEPDSVPEPREPEPAE
jgi:hypothetical protein